MKKRAPRRRSDEWILRLYVAGHSARSAAALRNLESICQRHLAGRYRIEVIDLIRHRSSRAAIRSWRCPRSSAACRRR
jgi:KaiB domain